MEMFSVNHALRIRSCHVFLSADAMRGSHNLTKDQSLFFIILL